MVFSKEFLSLKEIFPQIDSRVLKAVCIEHSGDIDAAVETVISEVIPYLSLLHDESRDSSSVISAGESSSDSTTSADAAAALSVDIPVFDVAGGVAGNVVTPSGPSANKNSLISVQNSYYVKEPLDEGDKAIHEDSSVACAVEIHGNSEVDETFSPNSFVEVCIEVPLDNVASQEVHLNYGEAVERNVVFDEEVMLHPNIGSKLEESSVNCAVPAAENSSITGESTISSFMSQSISTEVIEEGIHHAKNNKAALSSALLSVRTLMREVELKEQAAEEAKVEASVVVHDTLVKAEALKQMVQLVEEEKCKVAGEVYGEKAIQVTELKELHQRVLSLSDEKDKSLSLLDEMRRTLEARLAAAENEIVSAAREKEEKEKEAMESVAVQELALEELKEEMKMLEQFAEDNAKVQEFLLDRGQVVDALQGEIAVAYEDVRQLKERFDENIPLSKLLSSSQAFCNLAAPAEHATDDEWEIFEKPVALESCE